MSMVLDPWSFPWEDAGQVTTSNRVTTFGTDDGAHETTVQCDTDNAEVKAGAKLIEQERRIRELEEEYEKAQDRYEWMMGERDRFRGALKVMTEDRDHYQACAKRDRGLLELEQQCTELACASAECREMLQKLFDATKDERAIALAFVRKLMGEGRKEHGPLDLATDKRSAEDLLREGLDEGLDSCFYLLAAMGKVGL